MKPADSDQRKAFERLFASREVRLFCCNMFYSGTAFNLSHNSMFIITEKCIPADAIFLVLFRVNNELLKAFVRVKEVVKQDDYKYGIEVDVLNHNKKYLELVDSLKPFGTHPNPASPLAGEVQNEKNS